MLTYFIAFSVLKTFELRVVAFVMVHRHENIIYLFNMISNIVPILNPHSLGRFSNKTYVYNFYEFGVEIKEKNDVKQSRNETLYPSGKLGHNSVRGCFKIHKTPL